MPRPRKNLDDFRDEIEQRIANKHTQVQILSWLASQGVSVSRNTLSSRCATWEASRHTRTAVSDIGLISKIDTAYHTTHHSDQTIADNISGSGTPTTRNQVKRIRLAHDWRRRGDNDDQLAASRAETFSLVKQALQQGAVRCYGRGMFRTFLRVRYQHQAREDDVRDALAELDAVGTEARRKGPKKTPHGTEFVTNGPDFLWCCDGHDKFRNFGIEIYACVDAYSKRIQWCYVGNSNRRAVSILRQVVAAFREYGHCPAFFRSDRGKEVLLLADAHFSLYVLHKRAEGLSQEDEENLRLRDCYMFGTSTANIKIESLWMRMLRSQTRPWLVSSYQSQHQLYN
jgi:hypothetical protein